MTKPRDFFAAERTLLAWVPTGLTIMAFGFVVARFGLFLRLLVVKHLAASRPARGRNGVSNTVGISLVLLGTACMILGGYQHRRYVSTLPPANIPRSHDAIYPIPLSLFRAALGIVLAVYLAV